MHYYFDLHCRIFPDRLIWRGTISRRMAISTAALNKGTSWVTHWGSRLHRCCLWIVVFLCSWLLRSERSSLWASLQKASWAQRSSRRAAPPSPAVVGEQAGSTSPSSTWVNQFKVSVWHIRLISEVLLEATLLRFRKPCESEIPLLCVFTCAALLLLCLLLWSPFPSPGSPSPSLSHLWLTHVLLCTSAFRPGDFPFPCLLWMHQGSTWNTGRKKSCLIPAMTCGWRSSAQTKSVENVTVFADWGPH